MSLVRVVAENTRSAPLALTRGKLQWKSAAFSGMFAQIRYALFLQLLSGSA
jgi:hypothetical protein